MTLFLKSFLKQFYYVHLYHDLAFKIQSCTIAKIFMCLSCIAIDTTMLATLICIHRIRTIQIITFNFVKNGFGKYMNELRLFMRQIWLIEPLYMLKNHLVFIKT